MKPGRRTHIATFLLAGTIGLTLTACAGSSGLQEASHGAETSNGRVTWQQIVERMFAADVRVDVSSYVPVIRVVDDFAEHLDLWMTCLADKGWPVSERGGQSGWFFDGDEGDLFTVANFECFARYAVYEPHLQPPTSSQIQFIINYWLNEWIDCATDFGIEVPPPPTFTTLYEEWTVPGALTTWCPSCITGLLMSQMDALLRQCPEIPPNREIFAH